MRDQCIELSSIKHTVIQPHERWMLGWLYTPLHVLVPVRKLSLVARVIARLNAPLRFIHSKIYPCDATDRIGG